MTDTIANIFDDPSCHQIDTRLFFREVDVVDGGKRQGVVLATWNETYGNFALNCGEMERLLTGKRDGKLDEAYVVAAQKNSTGRYEHLSHVLAEELSARLSSKPTVTGKFGSFWSLKPSELNIDDMPF
jgi:hypothetical protein